MALIASVPFVDLVLCSQTGEVAVERQAGNVDGQGATYRRQWSETPPS
jgi:hypothetical protein